MTPDRLLTGQIKALERSLAQASDSLGKQGGAVNSKLLKRVHGRFENDLMGLRDQCRSLRTRIEQGASAESGWTQLGKLQLVSSDLMKECLAFLEGALVRDAGFDGGVCALADSMLYGLSEKADMGWQRFTLVAAGEFFSTISGIVRLRFSDVDIWNLPVAAHEFGHFVSATPKFNDFGELASGEKRKDTRYEAHLRELFSDLFATYALGPGFVLNCALLRFSPASAYQESNTHPSNAQRIWWMIEVLAKLDETEGAPMYDGIAAQVRGSWTATLKAAGQPEALSDGEISRLHAWLADVYDLVNSQVPVVRYRSILRAQEIYHAFRNGQTPPVRDDYEMPDVLNAAWLYRLNAASADVYELDQIGNKAFQMCETIANR